MVGAVVVGVDVGIVEVLSTVSWALMTGTVRWPPLDTRMATTTAIAASTTMPPISG
jgi:hypothetical protein